MKHQTTKNDNFYYLLGSLTFLLFSVACEDQFFSSEGMDLIVTLTIITMTIGVWSIRSTRYAFNTGIGLIVAVVLIWLLIKLMDVAELDILVLVLMLCFFLITLKLAAEQALFSGQITGNSIIGSICIYLLLGLIWATLYLLLAQFIPESFSGIDLSDWKKDLNDFVYFSFVTLTTLGYGDILPLSPLARFLVFMEAITGVFYMAIVVSSLVGARMSASPTNH